MHVSQKSITKKNLFDIFVQWRDTIAHTVENIVTPTEKVQFANHFLFHMLFLWIMNKHGFFKENPNYLVDMFYTYQEYGFQSYYSFLLALLSHLSGNTCQNTTKSDKNSHWSDIRAINLEFDLDLIVQGFIPDSLFYSESTTSKTKKGLLVTLEQLSDNLNAYFFGSLYEVMLHHKEKKKYGVFFTEKSVASFMTRKIITLYLLDKIKWLFKNVTQRLDKFIFQSSSTLELQTMLNILTEITILDPAMGTGHFLEAAAEELLSLYKKIWLQALTEKEAAIVLTTDSTSNKKTYPLIQFKSFDDLQVVLLMDVIFSKNLYGVDLSKNTVKIAQMRLFLFLLEKIRQKIHNFSDYLETIHFNLKHGNSLVGKPSDKTSSLNNATPTRTFHWELEFGEIFSTKNGFDIIIGNPPYLSSKGLPNWLKHYARERFVSAKGQFDLFVLFIEQSVYLLTENGFLTLIIPDSFLGRSSFSPIRKFLLEHSIIKEIVHVKSAFYKTHVSNVIIFLQKSRSKATTQSNEITFKKYESIAQFSVNIDTERHTPNATKIPQHFYLKTPKKKFIFASVESLNVIEKITHNSYPLGEFIHAFRGEELGKKSPYIISEKKNVHFKPILFGQHIKKFEIIPTTFFINEKNLKKKGYFQQKIVLRQLGTRLHAALDIQGIYVTAQSVYNLIITSSEIDARFILAILNSTLMDFYYYIMFHDKALFPRILLENVNQLPLILPSKKTHQKICNLTEHLIYQRHHHTHSKKINSELLTRLECEILKLYQLSNRELSTINHVLHTTLVCDKEKS